MGAALVLACNLAHCPQDGYSFFCVFLLADKLRFKKRLEKRPTAMSVNVT